jgi:hypothetical protein
MPVATQKKRSRMGTAQIWLLATNAQKERNKVLHNRKNNKISQSAYYDRQTKKYYAREDEVLTRNVCLFSAKCRI